MYTTALARWAAARRSRQLLLSIFPALCGLALLIYLGCYLLITNALSQDEDVSARSRTFISQTLDQVRNEVARNVVNYSKWGEAYRNLHLTVDKVWADDQRNIGDIPYDLYGYNGVLLYDAKDHLAYAVIDGNSVTYLPTNWLAGDLNRLVETARRPENEDSSVTGTVLIDGSPAIAAAGAITPGWDPSIQRVAGASSVLIFITVLNPAKLTQLSETYGLPAMFASRSPLPGFDSMRMGNAEVLLNWMPPEPGLSLLKQTLPLFIAAVLLLAGIVTALVRHAIASAREIDAQFDALLANKAELRHLSLHDSLTGLPNRHHLHEWLAQYLSPVAPRRIALLSLDLDNFKPINDRRGHAVGDLVLQEVAGRLKQEMTARMRVARLGGDEFVIVLLEITDQAHIDEVCSALIASICQPITIDGERLFVGTSIGIALAPAHASEADALLRMSDVALYQAKAAGRNTWRMYDEALASQRSSAWSSSGMARADDDAFAPPARAEAIT